jgi:pimeloyl-ACP methyl ester carboxylesterase
MTAVEGADVRTFRIETSQAALDDLRARLERIRWPGRIHGAGWDRGTDIDYLAGLVDYWRDGFDWRAREAELNRLQHVRVDVDGLGVHAIHQRSADEAAMPLLLLHGWPDSFVRYAKVLPLLADFHLVVPSLPGYGFSDQPTRPGCSTGRVADVVAGLMSALGYDRFAVSGGDVGSSVAEWLARRHAHRLIGLHLTDVPYWHLFALDSAGLSEAEQAYLAAGQRWQMAEGAYALLQSTKPMTAAYGLTDSPVGLTAWIVEKLRAWSDCQGDIERRFTPDEVLTNVMIYWLTGTIGSSFTVYYEQDPSDDSDSVVAVPTGVAIFPADLVPAPREFAERFFDLRRWTEMPRGGHFTAMEEPELFADDVRAFLTSV